MLKSLTFYVKTKAGGGVQTIVKCQTKFTMFNKNENVKQYEICCFSEI